MAILNNSPKIIQSKEYEATILEGELENDIECHYAVYIHQLMTEEYAGITPVWAKNEIDQTKYSKWLKPGSDSEYESAGSYTPLYPGMNVFVKFRGTSLDSAYITRVKSKYAKFDKRDGTYLINKTKNGSYILQNDNTNTTHIVNNDGATQITLDDSKITLAVNKNNIADNVNKLVNAIEIDELGTKMKFGNSYIILDASGIKLQSGDNYLSVGESGIDIITKETMNIISDRKLNMKSNQLKIDGTENVHLHSNDLKITGEQMLNLTGMVIGIDSSHTTYIKSTLYLMLSCPNYIGIDSLSTIDINATMNLNISSQMTAVSGTNLTLSGNITNLDSASLFIDGTIMHNVGSATASAQATIASNLGLKIGLEAGGLASATVLLLNSFANGIVASSMNSTLPGTAIPVGEMVKQVPPKYPVGKDSKQKLAYIQAADKQFKENVQHQFINLRNYHEFV